MDSKLMNRLLIIAICAFIFAGILSLYLGIFSEANYKYNLYFAVIDILLAVLFHIIRKLWFKDDTGNNDKDNNNE